MCLFVCVSVCLLETLAFSPVLVDGIEIPDLHRTTVNTPAALDNKIAEKKHTQLQALSNDG